MEYHLEIYRSGNSRDVAALLKSDKPFQAMQSGQLINVQAGGPIAQTLFARIVQVEHLLWAFDDGRVLHKVLVYTEAADDRAKTRPGR